MDYPWYELVDPTSDLEQGDFISACPLVIPPTVYETGEIAEVDVQEYNVIVMSQSCDLVTSRPKVGTVLVCPFGQISTLPTGHPLATTREQEKARRGHLPGFHILNECDIAGFEFGFSFVALSLDHSCGSGLTA